MAKTGHLGWGPLLLRLPGAAVRAHKKSDCFVLLSRIHFGTDIKSLVTVNFARRGSGNFVVGWFAGLRASECQPQCRAVECRLWANVRPM